MSFKVFNGACPLVKTEEKISLKLKIYEGKKSDFLKKLCLKIDYFFSLLRQEDFVSILAPSCTLLLDNQVEYNVLPLLIIVWIDFLGRSWQIFPTSNINCNYSFPLFSCVNLATLILINISCWEKKSWLCGNQLQDRRKFEKFGG